MSYNLLARMGLRDDLSGPLSRVTRRIEQTNNRMKQLSNASTSAGRTVTSTSHAINNSFSGVGRGIDRMRTSMTNASSSMASSIKSGLESPLLSVKNVLAGIAATAGVAGGKSLFDAGMNRLSALENSQVSLGVMMGDDKKAAKFMDDVLAFAKTTPFAFPDLAESARNLVAFGMDTKKVIPTLKAIGDAAAATGKGAAGLDQVASAFGDMQISSQLSMDQINRLQAGGVPALKILANEAGMSADTMKKAISKGNISSTKSIDVLVKGMQKGTKGIAGTTSAMAGIMERAKSTWVGSLDSMKSAVSSTMAELLKPIKPKLQAGMKWFGDQFKKLPQIAKKLKPLAKALAPIAKVLAVFAGSVVVVTAVAASFTLLSSAIGFLLSPIGLIAGAITALVVGFKYVYDHSETFRKAMDRVGTAVKGVWALFERNEGKGASLLSLAGLSPNQVNAVMTVTKNLQTAFGRVKGMFSGLREIIGGNEGKGISILTSIGLTPDQISAITSFVSDAKAKFGEFSTFVRQKFTELSPGIEELVSNFSTLHGGLTQSFSSMWNFLQPIFEGLYSAFQIVADVAVMAFNNILAPLFSYLAKQFQVTWKIVGPILELLGAAFGVVFEAVKLLWDVALKPVAEFLTGVFKDALESTQPRLDAIGMVFDWLGGKISGVTDWLRDLKSNLSNIEMPGWLKKLSGGGVVSVVTGGGAEKTRKKKYHGIDYVPYNGYQATLHKGEAVVTAQDNKQRQQGGSGDVLISGNTFHVREESDIQKIAAQLYDLLNGAKEAGAQ